MSQLLHKNKAIAKVNKFEGNKELCIYSPSCVRAQSCQTLQHHGL